MRATMLRFATVLACTILMDIIEARALPIETEQVIRITAKKFEFDRHEIIVRKGVPVVFELTSLDRIHGFNLPEFKLRSEIVPGKTVRVRFVPDRSGQFVFFCDIFCGDGHEEMSGVLIVKD